MKNVTLKDKMGPSLQGPIWCSRLDVTWLQSLLAKLNYIYRLSYSLIFFAFTPFLCIAGQLPVKDVRICILQVGKNKNDCGQRMSNIKSNYANICSSVSRCGRF